MNDIRHGFFRAIVPDGGYQEGFYRDGKMWDLFKIYKADGTLEKQFRVNDAGKLEPI